MKLYVFGSTYYVYVFDLQIHGYFTKIDSLELHFITKLLMIAPGIIKVKAISHLYKLRYVTQHHTHTFLSNPHKKNVPPKNSVPIYFICKYIILITNINYLLRKKWYGNVF